MLDVSKLGMLASNSRNELLEPGASQPEWVLSGSKVIKLALDPLKMHQSSPYIRANGHKRQIDEEVKRQLLQEWHTSS